AAVVEIVHADVGTLAGERQRDGTADTLLGARHQRHLAPESHRGLHDHRELCPLTTNVLGSRAETQPRREPMDKGVGLWLHIGPVLLAAALVVDFIWVIPPAPSAP